MFKSIVSLSLHIHTQTHTHSTCVQHKAYFLIQLNADSLYPFACWSLCLLCLLILILIILMLILIERGSMLIVYWLCDRKLINAYLTKTAYKILTSQKRFWKFKLMYCNITSMCLYIFVHINIILHNYLKKKGNQHTDMQIMQFFEC
mgnify:CR=1 FL=1